MSYDTEFKTKESKFKPKPKPKPTAFFQCLLGKMRFLEFMKQPHSRERTIFALPIMHLLKTVFSGERVKQGL